MTVLSPPWSGLSLLAPRVDLTAVWPLLCDLPAEERAHAPRLAAAGLSVRDAARVAAEPAWVAARAGVRFVAVSEPSWPARMRALPCGPVALALEGDAHLLDAPCVAVVGSRACTRYGREQAARLAAGLAAAGVVVVSGLAAGIDLAAHEAAGGRTIAVLGQGIDAPMPAWQARARGALLAAGGLVVSELPPTAHADTFTFPVRNRIVAGLADAVVVVEAALRSGARNTAAHARRFGREVLAVPGPLGAPASAGCLELLAGGATLLRGLETILTARDVAARRAACAARVEHPDAAVLAHLRTPVTPEALAAALGASYRSVTERLGLLELTGRVQRLPGGRYRVTTP